MIELNGCIKCENRIHGLFGKCRYYNQIISYLNQIDHILSSISPISGISTITNTTEQYNWISKIEFECKYFKIIKNEEDKKES